MGTRAIFGMLAAGLAVATLAGPAMAEDTGLATSLHETRAEGGRLCLVDHYHDGQGSGRSKSQAEGEAIKAWSSFTSFEYGSSWASFGNAAGKSMKCAGSGASWDCHVSARACRSGGGGDAPRRHKVRNRSRD